MRAPYIINASFKAFNVSVEGAAIDPNESNTRVILEKKPFSFYWKVVCSDGRRKKPVLYRRENAVEEFLQCLQDELSSIEQNLALPAKMTLTAGDRKSFRDATECHICGEVLHTDKVHDHCHIISKYRGAAHKACNLIFCIYPDKCKVPVVFHNLWGYDSYLIMQAIGNCEAALVEKAKIVCIPYNIDKCMIINLNQLQFIDSFKFLNGLLDKLSGNLSFEDLKVKMTHVN